MISKSISTSTKLAEVGTFARLLFTWIIPHCDDYGRMDGMPKIVRGVVVPLCDETVDDVAQALEDIERVGLIKTYEVNGRRYIQVLKWDEHQTFRSDRPRVSLYPNPQGEIEIDDDPAREALSNELRREVLERDGQRCRYCGNEQGPFHIDHVVPRFRGGRTTKGNLVVACESCNRKKNNKTLDELGWVLVSEQVGDDRQPTGDNGQPKVAKRPAK